MSDEEPPRLATEIELLEAMYPGQTHYSPKSREFKFTDDSHASLLLRLPETYPDSGSPDIISAVDASRNDVRAQTKDAVIELGLAIGEEALDAIIAAFQQILETTAFQSDARSQAANKHSHTTSSEPDTSTTPKTVIIWLHHLLNTNKRKLALSPTSLSGLTKPGYPGVLVYSGPSKAVTEHVTVLKAQNWQAFNVRYEETEEWTFAHGKGVREVETMAEATKGVECAGHGLETEKKGKMQKEEFLKAVGIK